MQTLYAHMEEIVFRSKYLQEIRILIYATIDETNRSRWNSEGVQRTKQIDPSTAVAAGHRRLLAKNKKYICIYAFCMRAFSNCCRPGSWHIPLTLGNCATDTREPSKPFMFIFGTSHTCHPPLQNSHTQIVPKGRINNPIFRWQPMVAGHPGRANLHGHVKVLENIPVLITIIRKSSNIFFLIC